MNEARETVLIVEDDAGIAALQQRSLERAGFTTECCARTDEARARIERGSIDLMLLDNRLEGGVEGLEFYRQLKEAGINLPVILVTGFSDDATVIRALRQGVVDYVTKSSEYLSYLPEAVRRALDQVRTRKALAESQARLAAVVTSAMDAIIGLDAERHITLFNPAAERIFACPGNQAASRPISEFLLAGLPADWPLKGQGVTTFWDTYGVRRDGQPFPASVSIARSSHGGGTGWVLVVRDITVRKKQEVELQKANDDLAAALAEVRDTTRQLWQAAKLASVGEMAASIAHELNNPLGIVSLRLEGVLAKTPADDPRRKALEIVEQELERMAKLVGNLLHFSRPGKEEASSVDLREEVERTLELMHHHLNRRGITVARDIGPEAVRVHADRQKLRQVFLNLVTNAADAMHTGGTLTLSVRPQAHADGRDGVLIEVADTGQGIAPELLPKVMEPFFTTKEEGKGTGLGLAICRRIVQEHQGSIAIDSAPGRGTTVRIHLPSGIGTNVKGLRTN